MHDLPIRPRAGALAALALILLALSACGYNAPPSADTLGSKSGSTFAPAVSAGGF